MDFCPAQSPHLRCPRPGRPGLRGPPALAAKVSLLPPCAPVPSSCPPAAAATASAAAAAGASALLIAPPPSIGLPATNRSAGGVTAPTPRHTGAAPALVTVCRPRPRGPCLSSGLSLDTAELLASVQDLEGLGSHVELPRLLPGAALHGNWAVAGPAVVRRVGRSLRALVRRGGWVALGAALDTVVPAEEAVAQPPHAIAWLDGAAPSDTAFDLHGTLVELSGPFKMLSPGPGTREHGGRLILTVPQLDEGNCILLLPGGCLSHPLCAMPRGVAPLGQRIAPLGSTAAAAAQSAAPG